LARQLSATLLWAVLSLAAILLLAAPPLPAAWSAEGAAERGVKVAGILIDKKDDWIRVKADGEDEPVKYTIAASDKKLREALQAVFNACRVQLIYDKQGDSRRLAGIKRQILKASGTVTGNVVKVYYDFWVEVKPKSGVADAYAPGGDNFNDKAFMEKLKGLKKGDSVTIKFTTDFERHRIKTLRKNPVSQAKSGGASSSGTSSKQ